MERRLSAILAADMVGYSRLMEADEVGTLERQKAHRSELIDPVFEGFHGRIVKEIGDGVLVEFQSIVDAVLCAVKIQRALPGREADVPDDRRIAYRIGINLGDIIVEGDDIYGDGVNVAARLEQIAEPGGICISGTAYDHMRANADIAYESLGEIQVKNIERPIRAYRVVTGTEKAAASQGTRRPKGNLLNRLAIGLLVMLIAIGGGGYWLWTQQFSSGQAGKPTDTETAKSKPTIAVLPFDMLSSSNDDDYFVDGLTEDLTTDLSKISGLFVIARDSAFKYKNTEQEVPNIARELGVKFLLKGSVRRIVDQLRINVQLIDVKTNSNLWADRFDGAVADVFKLQDDVTQQVVSKLSVVLTPEEKRGLETRDKVNPEAYDLFLRGRTFVRLFSPQGNVDARDYFQRVLAIDPGFGRAHAGLALTYAVDLTFGWSNEPEKAGELAQKHIKTALETSQDTPEMHLTLAMVYGSQRRVQDGIDELRKAVALDPNYADGHTTLGLFLAFAGEPEEAIKSIRLAMLLSPHHGYIYPFQLATAYFVAERYDDAIPILQNVLERNQNFQQARLLLICILGLTGQTDDADWEVEELLAALPGFSVSEELKRARYQRPEDRARYGEGLLKAGLPQ